MRLAFGSERVARGSYSCCQRPRATHRNRKRSDLRGLAGVAAVAAMSGRDLFSLNQKLSVADGNAYSPESLDELQRQYKTMRAAGTADSGSSSGGD